MSIPEDDKRVKNRFGWVKRLMQGQGPKPNSPAGGPEGPGGASSRQPRSTARRDLRFADEHHKGGSARNGNGRVYDDDEDVSVTTNEDTETHVSFNSDNITTGSYMDNVSTTPLKSIGSTPSTNSPSVLSDSHQDGVSLAASTAETSITPTVTNQLQSHLNHQSHSHHLSYPSSQLSYLTNGGGGGHDRSSYGGSIGVGAGLGAGTGTSSAGITAPNTPGQGTATGLPADRDSESIVTLASSSRRVRRRSLDTNCSTAGIPPASIMERLSVNPTAANSTYAVSMNDRGSVYNNDRGSVYNNDRGSVYNNDRGSVNDIVSTDQTSEQ